MHPLHNRLCNALTRELDSRDKVRIATAFPLILDALGSHCLSLRHYLDKRPEKFFDLEVYDAFALWLQHRDETDTVRLRECLEQFSDEINNAFLFLREINSQDWHDKLFGIGDEFDTIRFIDDKIHPAYLRLIEGVLTPLTRPVAWFSRCDRGKGTEGLDTWSVVQELNRDATRCFARSYRHIVRNGIAHGGFTFRKDEICYRDRGQRQETLGVRAVVRLFDDLLDACNGLAVAMKAFLLVSQDRGYIRPHQLLVEELQEETKSPWWTIEGCLEQEIGNTRQLVVFARPNSRHYAKIQWSTIQSGILAEYFAPGFDRYFFSLYSRKALRGWAGFDGQRLRELREAHIDDISRYLGVLENNCVYYFPLLSLPHFLGRIDTLLTSFQIHWPVTMQRLHDDFGFPKVNCRNVSIHRNSWYSVIRADLVIDDLNDADVMETIRMYRSYIVRVARKCARKQNRWHLSAYLPIGFVQLNLFRRDYRRRRLAGFGLGCDLICTLRYQVAGRIQSPDIMNSKVQAIGRWRFAWNRQWLDVCGLQVD
ncbi:MAG: hypothetical protein HYV27_01730 [Candidatus Hydrogenedentes bacterium]|nr:hypothetical protein [Candidatus Hydrogenedentota bacterium]